MSTKKKKKFKPKETFSDDKPKSIDSGRKISSRENTAPDFTADDERNRQNFSEKLELATKGLNYMSETDAGFLPYIGGRTNDRLSLLAQLNASNLPFEEIAFEDFFKRLTTRQNWFNAEQIRMTGDFVKLKKLLEENLRDLRVLKIGRIEIDIYIVGLDQENNLIGVRTRAVET